MSTANAGLAKKFGHNNIFVYLEGEPAWQKAGNPVYASKKYVETGNVVILDLRASKKAVKGRIARAVSVPYDQLEDRIDDIPRKAPVLLYSDNEEELMDAVDDLISDGFKHVALVPGGYAAWAKKGGAIESGPIASQEISWVRKLGKGEVSVADFKKATDGGDPTAFVIDSRTPEEVAELGSFRNTVNIPLDQIAARMNEIPKDKKIYVHCSTGARADMAYQELKKAGYNVKFLLLNISDAECDCEILKPKA
jgi:rhodanese-related sulfurtransferase